MIEFSEKIKNLLLIHESKRTKFCLHPRKSKIVFTLTDRRTYEFRMKNMSEIWTRRYKNTIVDCDCGHNHKDRKSGWGKPSRIDKVFITETWDPWGKWTSSVKSLANVSRREISDLSLQDSWQHRQFFSSSLSYSLSEHSYSMFVVSSIKS